MTGRSGAGPSPATIRSPAASAGFSTLRPFLRAYIVEDDLNGTPYSFEARNLVHARARGETDTHPFGTERDTDAAEYHWLCHSIAPESETRTRSRA